MNRTVVGVLVAAGLAIGAAPAGAQSISLSMPDSGLRGQTALLGSVTVNGFGVACNPVACSPGVAPLQVTPVCDEVSLGCEVGEAGVIALGATATGRAGTSCAGDAFTVAPGSHVGSYEFTRPSGPLVVPGGQSCTVDFTFDVLDAPAVDVDPGQPGIQTHNDAVIFVQTGGGNGIRVADSGHLMTITKYGATIESVNSVGVPLGVPIRDTATLTRLGPPGIGGTVTFSLYGPSDDTCASAPVFTSTVGAPFIDGPVISEPFSPPGAGTYQWVASYSGDAFGHAPATEACGAHPINVAKASPTLHLTVPPTSVVGGDALIATIDVTSRIGLLLGETVTFRAYPPSNTTCSGNATFTQTLDYPMVGGPVSSAPFVPGMAGTYRWTASFTGGPDLADAATDCNAPLSTTEVAKAAPALQVTATPSALLLGGGRLSATATVSGRFAPDAAASVSFTLYTTSDCSGQPLFAPAAVPMPTAGDSVESPPYTPTAAGTYRWGVVYSGDANNEGQTSACGSLVTVGKATPVVTGEASPDATLGGSPSTLADTITVDGRQSPADSTVTFKLYGPGDADCSGPPVFSTGAVAFSAGQQQLTSPPFTPVEAGSYRWTASYAGDANNQEGATACADAEQRVDVARATPTLTQRPSDGGTVGTPLSATAQLSGVHGGAGGTTVDFFLYGPDDVRCTGAPAFSALSRPVDASGVAGSGPFTPERAGAYVWVAVYAGDADDAPASSGCGRGAAITAPAPVVAPPSATGQSTPPVAVKPPSCRSNRVMSIGVTLAAPRGVRLARTAVLVNGKVKRVLGRNTRFTLALVGYPAGVTTVILHSTSTKGRALVGTRTYRLCGYAGKPPKRLTPLHFALGARRLSG